eukprot:SAG31_NODE_354_length_17223_cov_18.708771_20_plen_86_part_00
MCSVDFDHLVVCCPVVGSPRSIKAKGRSVALSACGRVCVSLLGQLQVGWGVALVGQFRVGISSGCSPAHSAGAQLTSLACDLPHR